MEDGVWSDALSRADLIGIAQILLTFLGFGLTVWQLLRTVTATAITNRLLISLKGRLLGNDLLLVLPHLQRLEDDLNAALKAGSQDILEIRLADYVRTGSETAALLGSSDDQLAGGSALAESLTAAVGEASRLRSQLLKGVPKDLRKTATPLMQQVIPLTGEISQFVGILKRTTGMEGEPNAGQ